MKLTYRELLIFILFSLGSLVARADGFILSAEGLGETVEEARISAATELGKSIISRVESTFTTEVAVANDKVSRDAKSKKDIASSQTIKSIKYTTEQKVDGGYTVTAGLDRQGVDDNISYFRKQLEGNLDLLNRQQLREALLTIDQLNAFTGALPGSVMGQYEELTAWISKRREQVLKRLNQGKVTFLARVKEFSVTVDGKPVGRSAYFEVGEYEFIATAEGYRKVSGNFSVSQGEQVKVKLPFIKVLKNAAVKLGVPSDYDYLNSGIKNTLGEIGVSVTGDAVNQLQFRISDATREVESFVVHKLELHLVALKNNKPFKQLTVRQQITVNAADRMKLETTLKKMVNQGLVALFTRMDVEAYFAK